ncbi:MAG: hypothetical protein ACREMD_04335, partial [Gemmatimonadota bacterium]
MDLVLPFCVSLWQLPRFLNQRSRGSDTAQIVREKIRRSYLSTLAEEQFGDMVKGVVHVVAVSWRSAGSCASRLESGRHVDAVAVEVALDREHVEEGAVRLYDYPASGNCYK